MSCVQLSEGGVLGGTPSACGPSHSEPVNVLSSILQSESRVPFLYRSHALSAIHKRPTLAITCVCPPVKFVPTACVVNTLSTSETQRRWHTTAPWWTGTLVHAAVDALGS